jgi:hypothetical protein
MRDESVAYSLDGAVAVAFGSVKRASGLAYLTIDLDVNAFSL